MATSPKPAVETPQAAKGLFGIIAGVFTSARQVLSNYVELITLEARRAGLALTWMVTLGAIAAMLVVTAWMGFMVAFALWLISQGMSPAVAIVLVASVNLLVAVVVGFACFMLSRNLLFPATRRQLKPRSSDNV
jgi:hypothetical protein